MLENFHVKNFRALNDLTIDKTAKINLIVGGNNVGKTSLLEAMYILLANDQEAQSLHTTFRSNIQNIQKYWKSLEQKNFLTFSITGKINSEEYSRTISGKIGGELFNSERLGLITKKNGIGQAIAISTDPIKTDVLLGLFGNAVRAGYKDEILSLLKGIDPETNSIEPLPIDSSGRWSIFVSDQNKKMIELPFTGQGFQRALSIYCRLLASERNIALIDEIEVGIHYQGLKTLWSSFKNVCQTENMQIFATTHSYECIQAAANVFKDSPEMFQLIRLVKTDEGVKALCFSGEEIEAAIEYGAEVR